ncbi:unnamed protein product, partial [Meganyctiphanes norvegica]
CRGSSRSKGRRYRAQSFSHTPSHTEHHRAVRRGDTFGSRTTLMSQLSKNSSFMHGSQHNGSAYSKSRRHLSRMNTLDICYVPPEVCMKKTFKASTSLHSLQYKSALPNNKQKQPPVDRPFTISTSMYSISYNPCNTMTIQEETTQITENDASSRIDSILKSDKLIAADEHFQSLNSTPKELSVRTSLQASLIMTNTYLNSKSGLTEGENRLQTKNTNLKSTDNQYMNKSLSNDSLKCLSSQMKNVYRSSSVSNIQEINIELAAIPPVENIL